MAVCEKIQFKSVYSIAGWTLRNQLKKVYKTTYVNKQNTQAEHNDINETKKHCEYSYFCLPTDTLN
jgi:uncharacterized protein YcnI